MSTIVGGSRQNCNQGSGQGTDPPRRPRPRTVNGSPAPTPRRAQGRPLPRTPHLHPAPQDRRHHAPTRLAYRDHDLNALASTRTSQIVPPTVVSIPTSIATSPAVASAGSSTSAARRSRARCRAGRPRSRHEPASMPRAGSARSRWLGSRSGRWRNGSIRRFDHLAVGLSAGTKASGLDAKVDREEPQRKGGTDEPDANVTWTLLSIASSSAMRIRSACTSSGGRPPRGELGIGRRPRVRTGSRSGHRLWRWRRHDRLLGRRS